MGLHALDISWRPGIGDPSILGWLTVVAYFAAAGTCVLALRRARRSNAPEDRPMCRLWAIIVALLLLLGINKQLDLQSLLTEIGRDMALAEGWYEERHEVQAAFILLVAMVSLIGLGYLVHLARGQSRRVWLTLAGLAFLFAFVMIRASSFHHVDRLLGTRWGGVRLNVAFELGGIFLVGVGAAWNRPVGAERRERAGRADLRRHGRDAPAS